VTFHFGIKGEFKITSLAAEILVSNLTVSLVYLNFGLNIFYFLSINIKCRFLEFRQIDRRDACPTLSLFYIRQRVLKILLFGGKSYKILDGRKKTGFPFSWE
jgi:hypothetical protein